MYSTLILLGASVVLLHVMAKEDHLLKETHMGRGSCDRLFTPLGVGIIGLPVSAMKKLGPVIVPFSRSGCVWVGQAPFCSAECAIDEDQFRTSSEHVTGESGHGSPCWIGEKRMCCRRNFADTTWTGTWKSAMTGKRHVCQFFPSFENEIRARNCGSLSCSLFFADKYERDESAISGDCDVVALFGVKGHAKPGIITFSENKKTTDVWFKEH